MASPDPVTVDTALPRSVSFAPPETPTRDPRLTQARPLVPVGPGRTAFAAPPLDTRAQVEVNGFPVQAAKVQPPPVRDETLRRDRLLDWLNAKIHHRVVLLIAEAGYGKTTLLADFSRRTRLRTLWYRLDDTDGDWVSFIGHLVASGRVHEPDFGAVTYGLLGEVAAGVATRDAVVAAFVRDLHSLGDAGGALVLDDYHLVDASPDVRQVMREVLARGPERLAIVISSRRPPTLPLGRMRAQGEVAELSVDDLRFDPLETERLFRESYGRALDGDVLEELHRRTEGWAASLHLVQTAVRDRSAHEVRAFVQRLSGAEGHLYDYLAEEVLGELPRETQDFLMRTSILQLIEPELASLVTGQSREECRSQIEFVERLGLLGRRLDSSRAALGYHPLVRDVLRDRLRRESGEGAGEELHRRVAVFAEARDWHLASYHYAAAGDRDGVRQVIDGALPAIMGSGAFLAAVPYLDRFDPPIATAPSEVIRSRVALANGDADSAVAHARRALEADPRSSWALANLASIHHTAGRVEDAAETARLLETTADDPDLARISRTTLALLQSPDQPIGPTIRHLRQFAKEQLEKNRLHYAGIAYLNAANLARVCGDADAAWADATSSVAALEASSNGAEIAAARMVRAWSLAHSGTIVGARAEIELAVATPHDYQRNESHIEAAMIEAWYGSAEQSRAHIAIASDTIGASEDRKRALALAYAQLHLRTGEISSAERSLRRLAVEGTSAWPDQLVQYLSLMTHVALAMGRDPSLELARAKKLARRQEAAFWVRYLAVLEAAQADAVGFREMVQRMLVQDPAYLSVLAEVIAPRVGDLDPEQSVKITPEISRLPERWRSALRTALTGTGPGRSIETAKLLATVGTTDDILRLRRASRDTAIGRGAHALSRALARRLARPVYVEDQLRVTIRIGDEEIPGSQVRRKVLALLCFLLSRPRFSATRDQVLDALWPDLDPDVAVNSLNQTVYFLRRVFEPDYREDASPGYLHHESDVVWLDSELVRSRSAESNIVVVRATDDPTPDRIDAVSEVYRGRFALDFAYEEWAVPYRESLHASYLQVIEAAVRADIATGHYDRAIRLARRSIEVDPDAEQLEISLLRLYVLTGAHAAAAEQYEHYAAVQRAELGVEPPPLDAL
jgi:LuxR family maltose regulon positive regulatory protein